MLAMLTENGPCSVVGPSANGWEVAHNPWSWSEVANMVWIDQPVGVGYSTRQASLVHDERQVAERMFAFLQSFYKRFPQYLSVPLFLTGESFAGHYVPAVAARVVRGQNDGVGMLQGMAIGNAEVDPMLQWSTKPEMAWTGGSGGSLKSGVVNYSVYQKMAYDMSVCEEDIARCQKDPQMLDCITAMMDCAMTETMPIKTAGLNLYDLRQVCDPKLNPRDPAQALCYNFTEETRFMNDPAVKESMGAHPWRPWASCNITAMIPFVLSGDILMSYRQEVAEVLAAGVRVLVYAGDTDSQVDWLGCRLWVERLPWLHQKEWLDAPRETVYLGDQSRGVRQSAWGLTFLQIFDAGHMVPHDQPEFALAMLREFLNEPSSRTSQIVSTELSMTPGAAVYAALLAVATLLLTIAPVGARRARAALRREEPPTYFLMA